MVHDHQRGLMIYMRVYSGRLEPGVDLWNTTRDRKERITRLLSIQADDMSEITHAGPGTVAPRPKQVAKRIN